MTREPKPQQNGKPLGRFGRPAQIRPPYVLLIVLVAIFVAGAIGGVRQALRPDVNQPSVPGKDGKDAEEEDLPLFAVTRWKQGNAIVRKQMVIEWIKAGRTDFQQEHASALAAVASDESGTVGETARNQLIRLATNGEDPKLAAWVIKESPKLRTDIAGSLEKMEGEEVKKAIPPLVELLFDQDKEIRSAAEKVLVRHHGHVPVDNVFARLKKGANSSAGLEVLAKVDNGRHLVRFALDPDAPSAARKEAIETLQNAPNGRSPEELLPLLKDSSPTVVMAGAKFFGARKATVAVTGLGELFGKDQQLPVRLEAIRAVEKIGAGAEPVAGKLLELLRDPDVGDVAADAVIRVCGEKIAKTITLGPSPDYRNLMPTLRILGKAGPKLDGQTFGTLERLLDHEESDVVVAAARAIVAMKPDPRWLANRLVAVWARGGTLRDQMEPILEDMGGPAVSALLMWSRGDLYESRLIEIKQCKVWADSSKVIDGFLMTPPTKPEVNRMVWLHERSKFFAEIRKRWDLAQDAKTKAVLISILLPLLDRLIYTVDRHRFHLPPVPVAPSEFGLVDQVPRTPAAEAERLERIDEEKFEAALLSTMAILVEVWKRDKQDPERKELERWVTDRDVKFGSWFRVPMEPRARALAKGLDRLLTVTLPTLKKPKPGDLLFDSRRYLRVVSMAGLPRELEPEKILTKDKFMTQLGGPETVGSFRKWLHAVAWGSE